MGSEMCIRDSAGAACDSQAEFEFALDLLLDGVERQRLAAADRDNGTNLG